MITKLRSYIEEHRLNVYQLAVQDDSGIQIERLQPCCDCSNIYSITKVFLNTAVGMLVDADRIKLDDPLLSYLKPYLDFPYDAVWDSVTVRHALNHRMGIDHGVIDIDRDDIRTYGTDNHLQYILNYPPKFRVGSYRKYNDCGHYLLSLAVEQVTGMPADDFIRAELLTPLGFQHTAWTRCPRNHTIGATGAYMRAEDIVKLGWLYLNNGQLDGRQLISPQWVHEMERGKFDLYPVKDTTLYHKGGMNGQMLLYCREKRVAVSWLGFEDYDTLMQLTEHIGAMLK